jgi:hypothetical protein
MLILSKQNRLNLKIRIYQHYDLVELIALKTWETRFEAIYSKTGKPY